MVTHVSGAYADIYAWDNLYAAYHEKYIMKKKSCKAEVEYSR